MRHAERELALQAQRAYERTINDWQAASRSWARARHRGAHLKGPRRAKPRGRPQAPDDLRFAPSVTRTRTALSHRSPLRSRRLDFHPSSEGAAGGGRAARHRLPLSEERRFPPALSLLVRGERLRVDRPDARCHVGADVRGRVLIARLVGVATIWGRAARGLRTAVRTTMSSSRRPIWMRPQRGSRLSTGLALPGPAARGPGHP